MTYLKKYQSPLGEMTLASDGEALTGLWFDNQKYFGSTMGEQREEKELPVFQQAEKWLDLYFSGEVPDYTPSLKLKGSDFRMAVWNILLQIPYGKTVTYKEIAEQIAEQKGLAHMSAQAVGGAVGHNPISLIVPCHRVVGTNQRLTGYAGGIEKKETLLKLERTQTEHRLP